MAISGALADFDAIATLLTNDARGAKVIVGQDLTKTQGFTFDQ